MKKYLGIDFGTSKIGIAVGDDYNRLAEPFSVLRFKTEDSAIATLIRLATDMNVETFVCGISDGKTALKTRKFVEKLSQKTDIKINFQDETFTTKNAQYKSIEAGIKRKKRKNLEDAYAAALILQNYLDG